MSKFVLQLQVIILFITVVSCNRKLTYEQLTEFVNEQKNGLTDSKVVNNVLFEVSYLPTDMLVSQYLGFKKPDEVDIDKVNEIRNKYKDYHYLKLSVSYAGSDIFNSPQVKKEHGEFVNNVAFGMQKYAYLITSENEKLEFVDSNYSPYYGFSPKTEILLVFRKEQGNSEYLKLYLHEFGLKTGNLNFIISEYNRELKIY